MALSFLTLALLSFSAGCHASFSVSDPFALFQGRAVAVVGTTVELGNTVLEASPDRPDHDKTVLKWPAMGEVWDNVKQAVTEITDQVGEVTSSVTENVGKRSQDAADKMSALATELSFEITKALGPINTATDNLLNVTIREKARMMGALGGGLMGAEQTLALFEGQAGSILDKTLAQWSQVQEAVVSCSAIVSSGLGSAGQGTLANSLDSAVETAVDKMKMFKQKLHDIHEEAKDISKNPLEEVRSRLFILNEKINNILPFVIQFNEQFEHAFQDLTDMISTAISWASEDVDRVFAAVQHNVTDIAWRGRSAARELVLGLRHGLTAAAKAEDVVLPAPAPARSAGCAVRLGALVAALAFAVAALL